MWCCLCVFLFFCCCRCCWRTQGLVSLAFERLSRPSRGGGHTEGTVIPVARSQAASSLVREEDLRRIISRSIGDNIQELLACAMTNESAAAELRQITPSVLRWIDVITSVGVLVKLEPLPQTVRNEAPDIACFFFVAESIAEFEETIWSPAVGIKGQIDLVLRGRVEMRVYAASAAQHIPPLREDPLAVHASVFDAPLSRETVSRTQLPVELKTGKWKPQSAVGHRAQVCRIAPSVYGATLR
jgi:hypothetical protein